MLRAMWKSLTNHIQDFHEGHSELYPKGAHGHLDEYDRDKEWLQPCEIYKPIKVYKTTVLTRFFFHFMVANVVSLYICFSASKVCEKLTIILLSKSLLKDIRWYHLSPDFFSGDTSQS